MARGYSNIGTKDLDEAVLSSIRLGGKTAHQIAHEFNVDYQRARCSLMRLLKKDLIRQIEFEVHTGTRGRPANMFVYNVKFHSGFGR